MTTETRRPGNAAALKGSWEALHSEAVALSRQGNDEALSKYGFLIERLARQPEARPGRPGSETANPFLNRAYLVCSPTSPGATVLMTWRRLTTKFSRS